MGSFRFR